MTTVPSNLVPTRISQLTEYDGLSQDGYLPYVLNGVTYKVRFGNIASVGAVPSSRTITGGGGLTGGGDLTANRVISIAAGGVGYSQLADSGVVAGTYGSSSEIPVLTVDAKGRVEIATTTAISLTGYVPTSRSIIAGAGLTGGGTLAADRTIALDLSAALPEPGGVAASGSSTVAARDDHVHPAVDLSDTTETTGVLPLARGGTGSSLSPVAGAILYSDGSNVNMSNPGDPLNVLFSDGTAQPVWRDITAGSTGLVFGLSGSDYALSGTLAIGSGGTGATTVTTARVNLLPSYSGNAGKALALNSGGTDLEWISIAGAGTVTSVNASGGTTGLTFSGGPITSAGTLTLAGTLGAVNGGTGITSYAVGDLVFANTTTTLDKLPVGASTFLLASNGTAPAYVNPSTVTVGNATNAVTATTATTATSATSATTATNIAAGTAGAIPYQSGAGATTFLSPGTGVLVNAGSTPSYSMTPTLTSVALTSGTISTTPTTANEIANKSYVDTQVSSGITYHTAVKYEVPNTTGNLTATYNQPGGAGVGVGATLTNAGTQAAFAPDGPTAQVGDRILVYNQTNAFENGVYEVTTVGSGSTNWVLTRTTDADTYAAKDPNGLGQGDAFFVSAGDTGAGETYVMNTVGVITFGTTAITFVQVSDSTLYTAGNGLQLTSGTVFSLISPVVTSNGGTGLTSFTSGGAVYATSTSALTTGTLPVASGGTGQTSYTNGQLLIGKTDGTLAKATLTPGTGISLTNGDGSVTVTNSAPDQTVVLTPGSGISISGTYPSFTIAASGGGTVTSVDVSGGTTGLTFSGGPVTAAGTITMAGTLAVANGGTNGTAAPTAGAVAFGTGTAYNFTSAGTAGQVLLSNGSSAPSFGAIDGGTF
jgi:fibronectin-binding autotransporter adhesin